MKTVNFVLYFGANKGKNALSNPQTVTTYANCDAVTREKEALFQQIFGYLCEMSEMSHQYAETSFHPSQTCFKVYQTTLVEPILFVAPIANTNNVGIYIKGLEKNTDIEFKFLLDMEINIVSLRNLEKAVLHSFLNAKKVAENNARIEEEKRQKEEAETFETNIKNSPFIQMQLKSRSELLNEIIQRQQLLKKTDKAFLSELADMMEKLSGKETASRFVQFMQNKLNS